MDQNEIITIARHYALMIEAQFDCPQIFLFGSSVTGQYQEESDIDVVVILKDFDNKLDVQLELMRLRRDVDSRIEPHPIREIDFVSDNPLAHEILEHGMRIDTAKVT